MIGSLVLEIAQAATLTVGTTGADYTTIAEAVAAAENLDTIVIAPGSYDESVVVAKHLYFQGGPDPGDVQWNGTGGPALTIEGDFGVSLHTISFSNLSDRCIEADSGYLYIEQSEFTNCITDGDGGAIYALDTWLSVRNTVFAFNQSSDDGGHISAGGRVHIAESFFVGGVALDDGGAIQSTSGELWILGSIFIGNQAGDDGGAIWSEVGTGNAYVMASVFNENESASNGGAIWAAGTTGWFDVYHSAFCGNAAGGDGGGLWHDAPYSWVTNSGFLQNAADGSGGGARLNQGDEDTELYQNVFLDNVAVGSGGGLLTDGDALVYNSVFASNTPNGYQVDGISTTHEYNLYSSASQLAGAPLHVTEITGDPQFVDDETNCQFLLDDLDLTPAPGSPLIDSGVPDVTDFDGSRSDLGIFGGHGSPYADGDDDGTPLAYDCDDGNPDRGSFTVETCNGIDDNCNGVDDDWDLIHPSGFVPLYYDNDSDGFGDTNAEAYPWCDLPYDDRSSTGGDCDDDDPETYPGAPELCDGIDNDCDPATVDPQDGEWWPDDDGDGYGDAGSAPISTCTPPPNAVSNGDDCDDSDATVRPGASEVCNGVDDNCTGGVDEGLTFQSWFQDGDGDGVGAGAGTNACASPGPGWVTVNGDCADSNPHRFPGNPEVCDGIDNDCAGGVDNGLTFVDYYADSDGDGLGNGSSVLASCSGQPSGYVQTAGDCDDNNGSIGAATTWFEDSDGDGYGDATSSQTACTQPAGFVADDTDCNDGDGTLNPATLWYLDSDGDDAGNPNDAQPSCTPLGGRVRDNTDCDDNDAAVQGEVSVWADLDGDGYGGGNPILACNESTGFVTNGDDCDDDDDEAFPGAVWYQDADGDGFGTPNNSQTQCLQPVGYVGNDLDCLDSNPARNPNTLWYPDSDGDGLGGSGAVQQCSNPGGYVLNSDDCNDGNGSIGLPLDRWPDLDLDGYGDASVPAEQLCPTSGYVTNGEDCDDDDDQLTPDTNWYPDNDGDTWGANVTAVTQCAQPANHVQRNGDCNDGDPNRSPSAQETCDGLDNDCNGLIDDNDPGVVGQTFWYRDTDGDQYGRANQATEACSPPAQYVAASGDCDDTDNSVYPGAPEVCDLLDNDCDTEVDEDAADVDWYADLDGDGWGVGPVIATQCVPPPDAAPQVGDCDDTRASVNPNQTEVCDGLDNNCDNAVDDGANGALPYWPDADGDLHGDEVADPTYACTPPAGMVQNDADCDDTNMARHYDAVEICDAWDNDCDGSVNVGAIDAFEIWWDGDGDGYGTNAMASRFSCAIDPGYADNVDDCNDTRVDANPGETEVCDGIDNNCDGSVDEGLVDLTYYLDADQDGFGDPDLATVADGCDAPPFTVSNADDCDDTDALVNPDATEIPDNGIDDDCDGQDEITPTDTGDTGLDTDVPDDTDVPGDTDTYRAPGLWFCATASPIGWSPLLLVLPLLVRRRKG